MITSCVLSPSLINDNNTIQYKYRYRRCKIHLFCFDLSYFSAEGVGSQITSVFCCLRAIATFYLSNCILLCILCTVIICTVPATSRCKHFLYWLIDWLINLTAVRLRCWRQRGEYEGQDARNIRLHFSRSKFEYWHLCCSQSKRITKFTAACTDALTHRPHRSCSFAVEMRSQRPV